MGGSIKSSVKLDSQPALVGFKPCRFVWKIKIAPSNGSCSIFLDKSGKSHPSMDKREQKSTQTPR